MSNYLARVAALAMTAALAACGGGGDDGVVDPGPSLGLDGRYEVSCYAVQGGDLPVSARSYIDIDGVSSTSSVDYFLGGNCRGGAFASVTYLTAELSGRGTKTVAGPDGRGAVAAQKVLMSTFGDPVRASGSVRLTSSGTTIEVLYPGTSLAVDSFAAVQSNTDFPDLLLRLGDTLYFGDDEAPLGPDGYPTALDYRYAWYLY